MPDNDMQFEIAAFLDAVRGDAAALRTVAEHRQLTLGSLAVMDEIRRQVGVRFPQD